jgi:endonuclease/exonuclease/phosphatase family metal-dependent hydrolase
MKIKLPTSIIGILLVTRFTLSAQTFNAATYNIRFDNPSDLGNLWSERKPHLVSLVHFHDIALIGTQEGLFHQLQDMQSAIGFPYIGVGRDDGKKGGEFSAIFYDPSKLHVMEEGSFWLSETPDVPSKGWDAAMNRVCTYGKFRTSEGKTIWVFNAHYDHIGQLAREESSKLVIRKVRELVDTKDAVIFMGDLNVTPDNRAYASVIESGLLSDSKYSTTFPPHGPEGTFNAFDWNLLPDRRIDYVFINQQIEVHKYAVLTDNYGKKYPSDHFPVFVKVSLK